MKLVLFVLLDEGRDVRIIEEKPKKLYRAKFFKFAHNRRPPYHGTWRKKSNVVGPRRPFAQDKVSGCIDMNVIQSMRKKNHKLFRSSVSSDILRL